MREPSSQADSDDDEADEWAQAERESLLERAEAVWQRTAEEWQPAFAAAYGKEQASPVVAQLDPEQV